jgi:hypothetical protein
MKVRSSLYRTARVMGDLSAIGRGPARILKRLIRKALGRTFGRMLNRWIP